jgi:hypothetical protein
VLAALRATGDGWQTRINEMLRASLVTGGAAALVLLRRGSLLPERGDLYPSPPAGETYAAPLAPPTCAPEPQGCWPTWSGGLPPSPLVGEGLGERGTSAKASVFPPPLPNPSPARGEGLKTRCREEVPG